MARAVREKSVQRDIVCALQTLGFTVDDLTQPRATMMPLGLPDLYARHAAWQMRLWIECKSATGRTRLTQLAWHQAERAAGGSVIVARSVAEVIDGLRALGAPIT